MPWDEHRIDSALAIWLLYTFHAFLEYAESEGVDLIVIGTKGSSGLKNKLFGSVASGVISSATCPAMVVK
jgi:nucleotide-binding universal stress UspA family protein